MTLHADNPPDVRRATGRAPSDLARSGVPSAAHPCAVPPFPRRPLRELLDQPGVSVACAGGSAGSAVQTLLLTPTGDRSPRFAVRVPATPAAEAEVEREARMLVDVRRLSLGGLRTTIPRFVQLCEAQERIVLVASGLPGRPLAGSFCRPGRLRHGRCAGTELDVAASWLAQFQESTWQRPAPLDVLPPEVLDRLVRLGRPDRPAATEARLVSARARAVQELLSGYDAPRSAVHGDFRTSRILVETTGGVARVSGVLGWRRATTRGEPLADLGRLVVTRTGCRGGRGRILPGAMVLVGHGAGAEHVRDVLREGLVRLGLPETLSYPIAWAATARVLAEADETGQGHLVPGLGRLLATAPDPAAA